MSVHEITEVIEDTLTITSFVFAMMVLVDYLNVATAGGMSRAIKGGLLRQYVGASFLGATPGCLGAYMNVSFYTRGLITFGALAGGMIATSGDASFVMLAVFPGKALLLFFILFLIGVLAAPLIDRLTRILKIKASECCNEGYIHDAKDCRVSSPREVFLQIKEMSLARFLLILLTAVFLYGFAAGVIGHGGWGWTRITFVIILSITLFIILAVPDHYLEEHIWQHIVKRHLWRIFLWSLGALIVVKVGIQPHVPETFAGAGIIWLIAAALVGLIPDSGPQVIFTMMFARGMIPFSALLTSSIVQDGHGLLPLLSYNIRDSILLKAINFAIGLAIGCLLYLVGI